MAAKLPWRAVTLDVTGTLLHLREPVGVAYVRHFEDATRERLSTSQRATAVAHINRCFPLAFEQLSVAQPNFGRAEALVDGRATAAAWWRELVLAALPTDLACALRNNDNKSEQFTSQVYAHYASGAAWRVFDDVHPTLDALRARGIALGVISNFDERLVAILRDVALLEAFDVVTTSWTHGAMKPHASIFTATFAALGQHSPMRVLHVGDHCARDYAGAKAAGAHARWLQRKQRSEASDVPRADTIATLDAVLAP